MSYSTLFISMLVTLQLLDAEVQGGQGNCAVVKKNTRSQ